MRSIFLVLALAFIAAVGNAEPAKYIDGNWFSPTFGAPGDKVIVERDAQLVKYNAAKKDAVANSSDIASRELCEELAIRSSVRGQYALEVGRLYLKAGDKVKAKAAYERAKAWGTQATTADYAADTEEEKGKMEDNKTKGAWVVTVAQRQLDKL